MNNKKGNKKRTLIGVLSAITLSVIVVGVCCFSGMINLKDVLPNSVTSGNGGNVNEYVSLMDQKDPSDIIATSKTDAKKAGQELNTVSNTTSYENTLRAILNNYYSQGKTDSYINTFTSQLDYRGDIIVEHYKVAAAERANASSIDREAGVVVAVFDSGTSDSTIQSVLNKNLGTLDKIIPSGENKYAIINTSLEYSSTDGSIAIAENDDVLYAQPNYKYTLEDLGETEEESGTTTEPETTEDEDIDATTDTTKEDTTVTETETTTKDTTTEDAKTESESNDPYNSNNPFLKATGINAVGAWDILSNSGTKVKVGVIDTGVRATHEDLTGIVNTSKCATIEDGVTKEGQISDNNGHGTHVCGIIAGSANNGKGISGVASGYSTSRANSNDIVELYVIDALNSDGVLTSVDINLSLKNLVNKNVSVINMSIGGPGKDQLMEDGMVYAEDNDVLCISAAGNESTTSYTMPGDYPGGICVINASSKTAKASTSNYGAEKDIAAPGSSIYSSVNTSNTAYAYKSGTSMATPVITGVAAMCRYQNSSIDIRDVKNAIYTSTDATTFNGNIYAFGYVDAYDAVNAVKTRAATNPTSIEFNVTSLTAYVDAEYTLEYRVYPSNTSYTDLTWSSSNNSIATVSSDGTITGVSPGTVTITATAHGGATKSISVTVKSKYTQITGASYTDTRSLGPSSAFSTMMTRGDDYGNSSRYMNGYSYNLSAGSSVVLSATSSIDTCIFVYDSSGKVLASNDNSSGNNPVIKYSSATSKTIYIEVSESPLSDTIMYSGKLEQGNVTFSLTKTDLTTTLTATASNCMTNKLSWPLVEGASGYYIYRYNSSTKTYVLHKKVTNNSTSTILDTSLKTNTTYYYKIRPYVVSGGQTVLGTYSNIASAKPTLANTRITSITAGSKKATIRWNSVYGSTGYYVYRASSVNGRYIWVKTIKGQKSTAYSNTNLVKGKRYYYMVKPYRMVGSTRIISNCTNKVSVVAK